MGNYILETAAILFMVYKYAIIFYILSSWVPALRENAVGLFIGKLVEPYLGIFRKIIPPIAMIDFSAIIALLVYSYVASYALEGLRVVLGYIHLV